MKPNAPVMPLHTDAKVPLAHAVPIGAGLERLRVVAL
jgi:hypothetical protein